VGFGINDVEILGSIAGEVVSYRLLIFDILGSKTVFRQNNNNSTIIFLNIGGHGVLLTLCVCVREGGWVGASSIHEYVSLVLVKKTKNDSSYW
jgi:hypothetical protein